MAQQTDYTGLITSEHATAPKFVAMVGALAQAFADIQNQLVLVPPSFDLDSAVGAQEDAVGLWVGVTRNITTPLAGVYFSLDVTGLGLDQGVWQGPFDPSSGVTSLDDETFRLLIRARIAANHWDGTLAGSAAILDLIFQGDGTYVFIQDNQDMTITIGISGAIPTAIFLALLQNGYIPIKPEGVAVNYIVTSISGTALFGFDVENKYVSGFDVGAWGVTNLVPQNYLNYSFALDVSTLG